MDPLAVNPLSPATLSALSAVRPVQAVAVPAPREVASTGSATGSAVTLQDLAQGVFQRTLQAATLFPLAEPAPGSLGLAQEAATSLLAALTAPQAPAASVPTKDATTNPAAVSAANANTSVNAATPGPADAAGQASATTAPTTATATTTPAATPAAVALPEVTNPADAFATSSSLDFALETALRFGAGVQALAPPAQANPNLSAGLSAGLVRDATSVLAQGNLQPHAGGPGPEAFTHPQAAVQRALRTYAPAVVPAGPGLDLLA